MSNLTQVQDFRQFEDSKILEDNNQYLVVRSIIASEIVQPYRNPANGKIEYAYKSGDELEKAAYTVNQKPIKALSHPNSDHLNDVSDVNGRMENPKFRKDLLDPKTKRPCRRGIEADLRFYRAEAPEVKNGPFQPISDETADAIRKGTLRDNSIGFSCLNDRTPGEYNGQHYDYLQRRIFIDHLAAPIEKGRCPSPYCGLIVDSAEPTVKVMDADLGISYSFDAAKYTQEQAQAYVARHKGVKDCPVCEQIEQIGIEETAKRFIKIYGAADALMTLQNAKSDEEIMAEKSERMTLSECQSRIKELEAKENKSEAETKELELLRSKVQGMMGAGASDSLKLISDNRDALADLVPFLNSI